MIKIEAKFKESEECEKKINISVMSYVHRWERDCNPEDFKISPLCCKDIPIMGKSTSRSISVGHKTCCDSRKPSEYNLVPPIDHPIGNILVVTL